MKNTSNLITGFFLVILGILLLLRNLNVLNFDIGDIFRLWPIALIYVGAEMLPVDPKTKMYLQIAVIVLFFIALISLPLLQEHSQEIYNNYESTLIITKDLISGLS